METLRGGLLFVIRWIVFYPILFCTYFIRNWSRSPFNLKPELHEKPGILVSNYGNFAFDDILGMSLPPVSPFILVPSKLFRIPILKWLYILMRGEQIVRTDDVRYTPEQRRDANQKTFEKLASLLREGHWLSVFPEAEPAHRSKIVTPLKPGVAVVALRAESASGWGLGLRIYVYGTNYENKFTGRSNLYVRWAEPIEVARYKEAYEHSPLEAEIALMSDIESALHRVVLEAENHAVLSDAHRLAFQRNQFNFNGVSQALDEVVSKRARPEDLHKIVCRARETLSYQFFGYALWGVGLILGWPFRLFGRLCAKEPSQEMTFQLLLWAIVFITGVLIGEWRWALIQALGTWLAMRMWLWAWRRGVVEYRT